MSKNQKRIFAIILLYIIIFGIFIFLKKNEKSEIGKQLTLAEIDQGIDVEILENTDTYEENEEIYVHISGEINYPGLLKMEKGQRLFEAVDMAGGMTENANIDQINLSIKLKDEDKIYIPKIGENTEFLISENSDYVNINVGSKGELMSLPGIGEKTADAIIEYRNKNSFKKIEDLMNVPGIGEQKFEKIKDRIIR